MTTTRVQLELNVSDSAAATTFYTALFGVGPHKQRHGYANLAIQDPPLKPVIFENPDADGSLNPLGVEATTPYQVTQALARFQAAGLEANLAEQDVCCHAVQDKVFVTPRDVPNGWWEYYAVTDDTPAALRTGPPQRASVMRQRRPRGGRDLLRHDRLTLNGEADHRHVPTRHDRLNHA